MTDRLDLTYSRLNREYRVWTTLHGDGRDAEGLRFGQHLWIKYDNMKGFTDVFNIESCDVVYSTLLQDIYE
jgi:hypothetical protein